jgi:hypothetical protein
LYVQKAHCIFNSSPCWVDILHFGEKVGTLSVIMGYDLGSIC